MSARRPFLLWVYTCLLRLYPAEYRAEYGDEMAAIFQAELRRATKNGPAAVWRLAWREARDLPGAAISQHRRSQAATALASGPATLPQAMAGLAPFLLLGVFFNLIAYLPLELPEWLMALAGFGGAGLLLVLTITGLASGLPAWWMPNLGIFGAFASLLFFNATIQVIYDPQRPILDPFGPWLERALFQGGYLWFGLLAIAVLLVLLAALARPLRPFYRRLRADWTLLSFGLYGAALPAVFFAFDDYVYDEPVQATAALLLAGGAWLHLRWLRPPRPLALILGLVFAAAATSLGKALLFVYLPAEAQRLFTWQSEVAGTLILWSWLALVVFSPALLRLLPAPPEAGAA